MVLEEGEAPQSTGPNGIQSHRRQERTFFFVDLTELSKIPQLLLKKLTLRERVSVLYHHHHHPPKKALVLVRTLALNSFRERAFVSRGFLYSRGNCWEFFVTRFHFWVLSLFFLFKISNSSK